MLNVSNLSVAYGNIQALWDVSFEVSKEEILVIIGANGAGKTTLLKTVMGFMKPTSGKIEFLGERIEGLPTHEIVKRGITMVPEGRRLFPYMTVLDNLVLGAYTPESRKKTKDTLKWVLGIFPVLSGRLDQFAGTLSGGEQQMLAVARSLMSKPQLLLLDEPSLGLAPIVVETVFEVVREINRQGVTVVLVEQNAKQALELARRAYVFETGRIVVHGETSDLLRDERIFETYLGV